MLSDGEAAKPPSYGSRVALVCTAAFTLILHFLVETLKTGLVIPDRWNKGSPLLLLVTVENPGQNT